MVPLLDRLIWMEIASSFGLAWGILAVLFVMNHLLYTARLAIERGIPVETAAILLLDKLPSLMVHTVPAGVLLGTMMGLSRLADRNEIMALRVCGVSLYRLAVPVVLAGTAATVGALVFAETVGSAGEQRYHKTLAAILRQTLPLQHDGRSFFTLPTSGGTTFHYSQQASPSQTLRGVTTVIFAPGAPLKLIQAGTARYDPSGRWMFSHGHVYVMEPDHPLVAGFDALTVHTPVAQIADVPMSPDEISLRELAATARSLERRRMDPWPYIEELHFRLAEEASSIAFALVAVPLSVTRSNARPMASLGLAIVVLIVYYLLNIPARLACDTRILTPLVAAWLPNIILVGAMAMLPFRIHLGHRAATGAGSRYVNRSERGHEVQESPVVG